MNPRVVVINLDVLGLPKPRVLPSDSPKRVGEWQLKSAEHGLKRVRKLALVIDPRQARTQRVICLHVRSPGRGWS